MAGRGTLHLTDESRLDRRSFLRLGGIATGTILAPSVAAQTTSSQDWRQYGRDQANSASNAASSGIATNATRKWDLNVNSPVRSGITVANDTVYAFGSNGDVYSVDDSENVSVFAVGAANGTTSDGGSAATRTATPAISDGALFLGGLDGTVYALDTNSRQQLWTATTGDSIRASPVVADGTVYVATTGGTITAYDQVGGTEQWSKTLGASVVGTPAVSDPALFVADRAGTLHALRLDTGESAWTFDADAEILGAPTLGTSRVFVATDSGTIYAISQVSGERDWDGTVPDSVVASAALLDGSLYVADREGTVTVFDADTGTEEWQYSTGETIIADPAVTEETLYLATTDGTVEALDLVDGSQRWEFSLNGEIVSPLTIAGGTLYAGRADGHLVSIQENSGLIATATTYGETALETIKRNPLLTGGLVGLTAVSAGGYAGFKRYRSRRSTQADDEEPFPGSQPAGDTPAIADRPTADRSMPDLTGVSYDDFETEKLIGSGGSANVHRATIEVDGHEHTVALKTPRMSDYETVDTSFFEEFVQEAEIWDDIDDHDAIVTVLGWGQQPYPWIALEYMEAGNLDQLLDDIDILTALSHLEQICDGVHHAHRHGVTHTDLKPENILYTSIDGTLAPTVTDWGLANVLIEHSTSVQGMTPAYAAPEQIEPDSYGGTDDRTDVYQLGVIAYELLTGQRPFDYDNYSATMNAILNESPAPPAELDDAIEPALSETVLRALQKDKERRYETVLHFRDALRRSYHESNL